jgi:hypothetical protein
MRQYNQLTLGLISFSILNIHSNISHDKWSLLKGCKELKCVFDDDMMLTIETMYIYNKPAPKCENCKVCQNLLEDTFVFHLSKENLKSIFYHMVDKILESNVFQLTYQVLNNKIDVCFGRFTSTLCFMQRIQA